MAIVSCFRVAAVRLFLAAVLTLAMPAQWDAFCSGWQSPHEAMACCQHASHDAGPSAAFNCCAAQEQTRHAQSPVSAMPAIRLVSTILPVPVPTLAHLSPASSRRARPADSRLLASVFQI